MSLSTAIYSPAPLATEEFFSAVLNTYPPIAVFDCDGTLWSRDAGSLFLTWSLEQGIVGRDTADWILDRYAGYKRGQVSEIEICGQMVQMYAGALESELRFAAERFFREHIAPHVFPEMEQLVRQLARQGAEIWAVSSTNQWVIEAALVGFGIPPERTLASRVEVRDGVLAETLVAVPSGAAKRTALLQAGVPTPHAVFGNSLHDAAMLAMAVAPFAVNPTPQLAEMAKLERWPIYWPAGTGPA
jgi:phosphoserine phosphatase